MTFTLHTQVSSKDGQMGRIKRAQGPRRPRKNKGWDGLMEMSGRAEWIVRLACNGAVDLYYSVASRAVAILLALDLDLVSSLVPPGF